MCSLYATTYTEPTAEQRQKLFSCPLQTKTTEQSHLSSSGNHVCCMYVKCVCVLHARVCVHACMRVCMGACVRACVHACMHACETNLEFKSSALNCISQIPQARQ